MLLRMAQKLWAGLARFAVLLSAFLFLTAGTLDYWQAWIYLAVVLGGCVAMGMYFLRRDPALLARRMKGGPKHEQQRTQKMIMMLLMLCFVATYAVPGFDRRLGWSLVPDAVAAAALVLVAISFWVMFVALRENSFASATIETHKDQRVIDTGPYRLVRHPYYSGALLMELATPVALGSYWGLAVVPVVFATFWWRLRDEERFLSRELPGYDEYCRRTRFRLIPTLL